MAVSSLWRMLLINIIVVLVLVSLLLGGYVYYVNSINYVSTQDAQVTGTIVPVTVPFAGRLSSWQIGLNDTLLAGDVLGTVSNGSVMSMNGGLAQLTATNSTARQRLSNMETLTSPITGTVIQNSVHAGEVVQPGEVLAEVVDLNQLTVTANIPETEIRHVSVGQTANVTVTAIPNTVFKGTVKRIGMVTTSMFSLVPNLSAASGSYTKIVQRIPVVISLDGGYSGQPLLPGMNADVTIQVNNNNG